MTVCDICGVTVKKFGIGAHKRIVHNPEFRHPHLGKSGKAWNKGLSKESHPAIAKYAKTQSESKRGTNTGYHHTLETRLKISNTLLQMEISPKLSRKTTEYETPNGDKVWLHSSFEIKIAQSLDENEIEWSRPSFFKYLASDGKIRRYFPDFYLPRFDVYLDPKNDYLIPRDLPKIRSAMEMNDIRVLILTKDQLSWDAIKELI